MPEISGPPSERTIKRYGLAIALGGALIQLILGFYYLSMAHAPTPHDLPVGIVAPEPARATITTQLEAGQKFKVEGYNGAADLISAIKHRDAYGGVVLDGQTQTLYLATAASPSVANLLRSLYASTYQQQIAEKIAALPKSVPVKTVETLSAPPAVTDIVPLPANDSSGSSLAFVIQALALGGSIASISLGRLGRFTTRSLRRGLGHAALLIIYAALSAGVALLAMQMVGVGAGADHFALFRGLALVSLAITASVAAAVALIGPAGTLLGGLYFVLGLIISGASIAPEMLPTAGRVLGQLLPPGAGATVVRDSLYFPDASNGGPLLVLSLFAGLGLIIVLITNARRRLDQEPSPPNE